MSETNGKANLIIGVSALGVVFAVLFGIAKLQESQIDDAKNINLLQITDLKDTVRQLRLDKDRADEGQRAELGRREAEIKGQIGDINHELDLRRTQFVEAREFAEFRARILGDTDSIRARTTTLEATRPTTGELQAEANATAARIDQLYRIVVPSAPQSH